MSKILILIDEDTVKLALEALENSVDLVREDAYQAEKLYGNYPTRQGKVNGLKVLADDHEKAITAMREALAEQPAQQDWEAVAADQAMTIALLRAEQPAPVAEPRKQEPVFTYDQVKAHIQAAMMSKAQRTWVGLTDEEIEARAISFYNPEMYKRAVLWAQEKLKERNQ